MTQRMIAMCLATLFTGVSALADDIQINVYTALAPNATSGSPSFGPWASNAIYALEHNLPAYGTPGTPALFSETTHLAPSSPMSSGTEVPSRYLSMEELVSPTSAFPNSISRLRAVTLTILWGLPTSAATRTATVTLGAF